MHQEQRNERQELDRSVHHQVFDYFDSDLDTSCGSSSADIRSEYLANGRKAPEKQEEAATAREPEIPSPKDIAEDPRRSPEEILKQAEGATGKLFDDAGRAWERGEIVGAAGRVALGSLSVAMGATGVVLQGAGVLVTLGSAGVAYLGHLGWDLSVANYGMMGVFAGLSVGTIGYGITSRVDLFSHYVRERFGDTDR